MNSNLTTPRSDTTKISPIMAREKEPVKVVDPATKKKKKNAPDRPQPTWMFPPDKENPVLNPKVISEDQKQREEREHEQAIRFLKYKSVSAPMKAAPPSQLLSLVGAFLTTYGFNSTSRIYTIELNARKKLDDWDIEIGQRFDRGLPGLVKIYKDWHKEWQEKREREETSSEEENSGTRNSAKKTQKKQKLSGGKAKAKPDETSSSGSSGSSSEERKSDVEMEDAPTVSKVAKKTTDVSPSSGTSSSSSDSDADDEKDVSTSKATSSKPTVNGLVNKLKRKTSSSGSSSSSDQDPDSSSSDESEAPPAKKKKVGSKKKKIATDTPAPITGPAAKKEKKTKAQVKAKAASSTSSSSARDSDTAPANKLLPASTSDDSSSNSESDTHPVEVAKPTINKEAPTVIEARKTSTDSSATLEGGSPKKPSSSSSSSSATSDSSSSDSDDSDKPAKKSKKPPKAVDPPASASTKMKRKRSASLNVDVQTPNSTKLPKKQNTPFSRIPQDTKVDPKLASNAYVPYDYAQRAHEDLVVTKGKGFTKEKNKKKR